MWHEDTSGLHVSCLHHSVCHPKACRHMPNVNCLIKVYNRTSLSYFFGKVFNSHFIAHDIINSQGQEESNHMRLIIDSWWAQGEFYEACNLKSDNHSTEMVQKQIKILTYWQLFAGGSGFFSFSWHGPVTLLSETNYAGCQSSSFFNRLCCCGSLEGRSFILLSTPICPRGFFSSVAESVPLHLPQDELRLCFCVQGCGRDGKRECVCVPSCVQEWLHVLVAQHDLCASVCACVCARARLYTCSHRSMCCFHNADCVCASHAAGSWLIDHATHSFLSTLSANHKTARLIS